MTIAPITATKRLLSSDIPHIPQLIPIPMQRSTRRRTLIYLED